MTDNTPVKPKYNAALIISVVLLAAVLLIGGLLIRQGRTIDELKAQVVANDINTKSLLIDFKVKPVVTIDKVNSTVNGTVAEIIKAMVVPAEQPTGTAPQQPAATTTPQQ